MMTARDSEPVSISNLALALHTHAQRCADSVRFADDRAEHIRLTQIALEAARLALQLDQFISQNTEVGTSPVVTIPLPPQV